MYCTNCGAQIPDGTTVCTNCSEVKKPSVPVEDNPIMQELITPVEVSAAAAPVQPEPQPVENNTASYEPVAAQEPVASSGYNVNPAPQAEPEPAFNNAYAPNNDFGSAPSYGAANANAAPQQPNGAPIYQTFNQYQQSQPKQVVTTGQWILRMLINLIPCVGPIIYFIMLFVWMNDKTKEDTSANWAKAQLIWIAISVGIGLLAWIILFAVVGLSINELFRTVPYQYDVII